MNSTRQPAVSNSLESDALLVRSQSVLKRRRERAAYAINELRLANRTRNALVMLAVGCALVALIGQIPVRNSPAQERPLPLTNPSRANNFDRFTVDYTVRDKDTLWAITSRFYGAPSPGNIRKVRAANPGLSPNDRELKIGITLKIPIQ